MGVVDRHYRAERASSIARAGEVGEEGGIQGRRESAADTQLVESELRPLCWQAPGEVHAPQVAVSAHSSSIHAIDELGGGGTSRRVTHMIFTWPSSQHSNPRNSHRALSASQSPSSAPVEDFRTPSPSWHHPSQGPKPVDSLKRRRRLFSAVRSGSVRCQP